MTEHSEALRLAEVLEAWTLGKPTHHREAAAELRRLHTLCGEWEKKAATWLASPQAAQRLDGYRELAQRLNAAEAVNQELLEALKRIELACTGTWVNKDWVVKECSAAIAKAEGKV